MHAFAFPLVDLGYQGHTEIPDIKGVSLGIPLQRQDPGNYPMSLKKNCHSP